MNSRPEAILSFDMEFWHNSEFLRTMLERLPVAQMDDRMEEQLESVLTQLHDSGASATLFILGSVAERYPHLIKRIADEGHEIASHGYSHRTLETLTPDEFRDELRRTNDILHDICGGRAVGFRAPRFSLTQKTEWAVDVLRTEGFTYDSSIFPSAITPYGSNRAPTVPYRMHGTDIHAPSSAPDSLLELPIAAYPMSGVRVPVGGGIYFRALPYTMSSRMLESLARVHPPMLYFHTHEFDTEVPKKLRGHRSMKTAIKYVGTAGSWQKFQRLLGEFHAVSVEHFLTTHALRA